MAVNLEAERVRQAKVAAPQVRLMCAAVCWSVLQGVLQCAADLFPCAQVRLICQKRRILVKRGLQKRPTDSRVYKSIYKYIYIRIY